VQDCVFQPIVQEQINVSVSVTATKCETGKYLTADEAPSVMLCICCRLKASYQLPAPADD